MLEHAMAIVELFLAQGIAERFSPRAELVYTILDADAAPATYCREKWI